MWSPWLSSEVGRVRAGCVCSTLAVLTKGEEEVIRKDVICGLRQQVYEGNNHALCRIQSDDLTNVNRDNHNNFLRLISLIKLPWYGASAS
jgi:hypothetical protein